MFFVDINTFYNPYAGGIRTYHRAKMDWFKKHPEHSYMIVGPADKSEKIQLQPNVTYWKLKGIKAQKNPNGYKFMFNLRPLLKFLKDYPNAVIEIGDPWWTSIVFTRLKKWKKLPNPLSFFHHTHPLICYIKPWAEKGVFSFIKKALYYLLDKNFYKQFKIYDDLVVSSDFAKSLLEEKGLGNIATFPFGAPDSFFDAYKERSRLENEPLRLIYAGRLQNDKDIFLLIKGIPLLLQDPQINITVMGHGAEMGFFENFKHPQFRYLGYIQDKQVIENEFRSHHILLATSPNETFGLSILEAMAMGMPVIGADIGGSFEILQKLESHLIFKTKSVKSFVETVKSAKSIDLGKYSRDARRVAEQYGTWETAMNRQMSFYLEKYKSS
jgi:alpha-1,6-mannosyltransferase